jgi:acyl carrier protein
MDTQLEQAIRRFVVDTFLFGKGGEALGDGDSLLDRGIIDSTGVLELVGFIEGEFGIVVDDDDLVPANLDSIAGLAAFVRAKRNAKSAAVEG